MIVLNRKSDAFVCMSIPRSRDPGNNKLWLADRTGKRTGD